MTFSAWTFSALGLAGVLVVALYQVKDRRIDRVVPYLRLFLQDPGRPEPASWYRRIRHPFSLLLQLLLLSLLAAAIQMRAPERLATRPAIWLIDAGIYAGERSAQQSLKSRREVLVERLQRRIEHLGEGTLVSLIAVRGVPDLLLGPTDDKSKLRRAAEHFEVQDGASNFAEALELARRLGYPARADVVVFADERQLDLTDEEGTRALGIESVPLARVPSALSIQAFAARRYPLGAGQFGVTLTVHSDDPNPVLVRAKLSSVELPGAREAPLEVAEFLAHGGADTTFTFPRMSAAYEALVCKIERVDGAFDPILADNEARAVLPREPPIRVRVVGEESLFLTAALLAVANVELEHVKLADYPPLEGAEKPALTIFRGVAPLREKGGGAFLFLGSAGPGQPVGIGSPRKMFGIDEADRRHKLFRFFDPYDTQILSGHVLVPGQNDRALAKTGSLPLVVEGVRGDDRFISVGFAPEDSDMILRSAFPLFMRGVIEEFSAFDSSEWLIPARSGQEFSLKTDSTLDPWLTLTGPLGTGRAQSERVSTRAGRLNWTFSRAGFYQLQGGSGSPRFIAVNADRGWNPAEAKSSGARLTAAPKVVPPWGTWFWIAALLLALTVFEYYSFQRKWIV